MRTKTRWSSSGKMKIRVRPILKKIKAKTKDAVKTIRASKLVEQFFTAPDGTPVSIKDMDELLKLNKTNPANWLRGYKSWKKNKERSDTMAKKKTKKAKKKSSPLDKISKALTKLEALHEKQSDMIFDIQEIIDDAQMDDDSSYHLD